MYLSVLVGLGVRDAPHAAQDVLVEPTSGSMSAWVVPQASQDFVNRMLRYVTRLVAGSSITRMPMSVPSRSSSSPPSLGELKRSQLAVDQDGSRVNANLTAPPREYWRCARANAYTDTIFRTAFSAAQSRVEPRFPSAGLVAQKLTQPL